MPSDDRATIDALLREREGYARYGRHEKVAEVDAQLALRGYQQTAEAAPEADPKPQSAPAKTEPETASLEATETAAVRPGRPRRSNPNA